MRSADSVSTTILNLLKMRDLNTKGLLLLNFFRDMLAFRAFFLFSWFWKKAPMMLNPLESLYFVVLLSLILLPFFNSSFSSSAFSSLILNS